MSTVATKHPDAKPGAIESHAFTLILSGFDQLTDEIENRLFEAGCDDALLGIHTGTPYLSFDREAESLEDAIKSAIKSVQSSGLPIEIVRVNPPGAETIETVNAYLTTRRQLHEKLKTVLPEKLLGKIDEILDTLMNDNPGEVEKLLK
jgi:hypothetical protein